MDDNNYLGFALFFLFIVLLVVGGSFLLYKNSQEKIKNKSVNDKQEVVISDKYKKEKDKDFIYYTEQETISEELNITSKYPVINLESTEALEVSKEIKEYVNEVKKTLVTLDSSDDTTCEDENIDNIKSTNFLDYAVYSNQEYITLFISESSYSCKEGVSPIQKMKSYTFNVLTGELLSFSDLLSKYNTNYTNAIELVKSHLNENQTTLEEDQNIKIEETMNLLKEQATYVIYIDEFGDLIMKYIVKTNTVDYNDNIILNK